MNYSQLAFVYFLLGILNVINNQFIRKLDTDGDPSLPWSWFGFWPLSVILNLIVIPIVYICSGEWLDKPFFRGLKLWYIRYKRKF